VTSLTGSRELRLLVQDRLPPHDRRVAHI